jgi:hypothetical protein
VELLLEPAPCNTRDDVGGFVFHSFLLCMVFRLF